jgi:CheY-like chemotaxis protein
MAHAHATILICEDEPSLRELVKASLEGDYEFAEAEDGVVALQLARELEPDLLVLDVMMPRLDGLAVLRELRADERLRDSRVIVLTAQPMTREEAVALGADRVLDKPFTPDDLAAAVKEVLAEPR